MNSADLDMRYARHLGRGPSAESLAPGCRGGETAIRCEDTGAVYAIPKEGTVPIGEGAPDTIVHVQAAHRALFYNVCRWPIDDIARLYKSLGARLRPGLPAGEMVAFILEKIPEKELLKAKKRSNGTP